MIPRLVDGLHYHLPFYREVVSGKKYEAQRIWRDLVDHFMHIGRDITSTSIEPMGDGWAVMINLEASE